VVLALIFMLATKTVHPPAGANPLIMVQQHAGFISLWQPVGLGIMILALVAFAWSRILPGMNHYPTEWLKESPSSYHWDVWNE
jgi:CBS-domain-containing membrane protein